MSNTNRTRELFDFAQGEPLAVEDMAHQIKDMNEEEIEHVEQVARNLLDAIWQNDGKFPEE